MDNKWHHHRASNPSNCGWVDAWWIYDDDGLAKRLDGKKVFIITLPDTPGFFVTSFSKGRVFKHIFPPFETLELAQLAYELTI